MICCGKKKKLPGYKITSLYVLSHRFRFSAEELINQQHRFERMSENGTVSIDSFSLQLGTLGNKSISSRIFKAMNTSGTGQVSFEEYLEYMDILIHGTEDQKARQSFNLIKSKNSDVISKEEFNYWLVEMLKSFNLVTGKEVNTSHQALDRYFEIIDIKKDGKIDFDEYKITMREKKEIFDVFNVISAGLEREVLPVQVIEPPDYIKRLESVEEQLKSCIQMIQKQYNRGPKSLLNPEPEHEGDVALSSISSIDFESILSFADESVDDNVIPECIMYSKKVCEEGDSDQAVLSLLNELQEKLNFIRVGLKKEKSNNGKINMYKPPQFNKATIQWGDEDWNLILNMMLGIQKSVQVAQADLPESPAAEEFEETARHNLLLTKSAAKREICQFKDYCPKIFLRIRRLYNISNDSYLNSLGVIKLMNSLFKGEFSSLIGLVSAGKSGCFFYHSSDGQYMLKTMTRKDYLFLKTLLPGYYEHLKTNPNTLIVRYFGFHKILYKKGREFIKQYFVVMGNVFKSPLEVHMSYDLKGSTHGRSTDDNEDFAVPRKDLDFNQSGLRVLVSQEMKENLLAQVEADCEFLRGFMINDYSFLLGIHNLKGEVFMPDDNNPRIFERSFGGILSDDNRCIYFVGIIDVLTVFNFTKKLEHLVKSQLYGNSVSCVPPEQYSQRFLRYLRSIIS